MVEKELTIEGMSCQHCVMAVRKHLAALGDIEVREVTVGSARVAYEETTFDPARLEMAIVEAGYRVRG